MPAISAPNLAILRAHPHYGKFYLAVRNPGCVFTADLNDAGAAYGDQVITYDNPSDANGWQNVYSGMTLFVGSSSGLFDKGRVRIKSATSSTITVAENQHINWADDDYLYVANVFEPWVINPRIEFDDPTTPTDIIIYEDYDVAYSDQNKHFDPVPIMGPPAIGFLSGGSCTFSFDGSESYGLAGATISSYSWKFPSGTPATSAVATPGNVSWSTAGSYNVTLQVTDSNGKTAYGHRWVRVYDGADPGAGEAPFTQFEVLHLGGNYDDGTWRAGFTVRDQYTRMGNTYLTDGTQVALFVDSSGSLPIPNWHSNRDNILYVGWVIGETIRKDPMTNDVSFETCGICGRMASMGEFSHILEVPQSGGDPSKWYEIADIPDMDTMLASHLRWRSTLFLLTDVFLPCTAKPTGYAGAPYNYYVARQNFAQGDLYSQCQQFLDAAGGRVASDKWGAIWMRIDPNLYPTAARAGIASMFTITNPDWKTELQFERRVVDVCSRIDLAGVAYAGGGDPENNVTPLLSLAPGTTPRPDGSMERVDGAILDSQAHANQLSGDILAWKNNEYPRIHIPMSGMWTFIDICPPEYITWTLASTETKREISWTGKKFLPRGVAIQVFNAEGRADVVVDVEAETDGPDGVSGVYPPTGATGPAAGAPVAPMAIEQPPTYPDEPPPYTCGETRDHVYIAGFGGVYYTSNFSEDPPTGPNWVAVNDGMPASPDVIGFAVDPASPEAVQYCCTVNEVYVRTGGGAWQLVFDAEQCIGYVGGAGTWDTSRFWGIYTSRLPAWAGSVYLLFSAGADEPDPGPPWDNCAVYCLRSDNYGSLWQPFTIDTINLYHTPVHVHHMGIDHNDGNTLIMSLWHQLSGMHFHRSTDRGVTWADLGLTPDGIMSYPIVASIPGDAGHPSRWATHRNILLPPSDKVMISTTNGSSFALVGDQGGWVPYVCRNQTDPHAIWICHGLTGFVYSMCAGDVYRSYDYGVTWERDIGKTGPVANDWNPIILADVPDLVYMHNSKTPGVQSLQAACTTWGGAEVLDKSGDLPLTFNAHFMEVIWTL